MINRQHEHSENCWCVPRIIFNGEDWYGDVWIHRKNTLAKYPNPGADTLLYAIMKAMFESETTHIVPIK